jgi:DNA-binding PadR family transcriptional regulator
VEVDQCSCSGKSLARLVRPAVLALLAREEIHGYVVVGRLRELPLFGDCPPDASGVYKTLKAMERDGLVSSSWETGDSGPAKRRYRLTEDGATCLAQWHRTLAGYRARIDALLELLRHVSSPAGA